MQKVIEIESKEGEEARGILDKRRDAEAARMRRFLDMPDLSRLEGSPIKELAKRIIDLPEFKSFDVAHIPEIVPARESFDLFNFPPDHPARSRSDTYYVNDEYILRTHTTIMWYYYLGREDIKEKIARGEPVGVLSYGKVYRKDEIDRKHMNVFHQMDGLYLARKEQKMIGIPELQQVLSAIAKAIYGSSNNYRFNPDTFTYKDTSIEMEE